MYRLCGHFLARRQGRPRGRVTVDVRLLRVDTLKCPFPTHETLTAMFQLSSLLALCLVAPLVVAGPCDIYASGSTPFAAAHSTTRALFNAYSGSLYQIKRGSDGATTNIGPLSAGGVANAAVQDSFCASTTCLITTIFDHNSHTNIQPSSPTQTSPSHTSLPIAPTPTLFRTLHTPVSTPVVPDATPTSTRKWSPPSDAQALKLSASWNVVAGLGNSACVSFESRDTPGSYIRHSGFELFVNANDGSKLFSKDATWCPQASLNGQGNSIRSWSYPAHYFRHFNAILYAASNGGPAAFDATFLFNDDVSWVVGPAFA
ncbi:Alpha-L-arabinofuranosidase B [Mycena sanguinolenta]|uniref:Alpha-L-arabinofuranosidase n=1 Tax=Mycena sanguinolenta TaxID=230812 RepID=A0A8H7CQP1_9AGAR|nr:Alpha-L-arabinofuranosidase B [Mycena sanguinolenta]